MRKKLVASGIVLIVLDVFLVTTLKPSATHIDISLLYTIEYLIGIAGMILLFVGLVTSIAERL